MNLSKLYLLDRKDGKVRQSLELPSSPTAGLACDIQQCYVTMANNRVVSVGIQPEDLIRGLTVRKKPVLPESPPQITLGSQASPALETTTNRSPSTTLLKNLRPPYEMSGRDVSPSLMILQTLRKPYGLPEGNSAPSTTLVPSLVELGPLAEISSVDRPRIQWELQTNRRMEDTPHIQGEYLVYSRIGHASFGQGTIQGGIYKESDDSGSVIVIPKFAERQNRVKHQYLSESAFTAPVGALRTGTVFLPVRRQRSLGIDLEFREFVRAGNPSGALLGEWRDRSPPCGHRRLALHRGQPNWHDAPRAIRDEGCQERRVDLAFQQDMEQPRRRTRLCGRTAGGLRGG